MVTKRIVGCSILPFARDPQYNNLYFYLGRERRCSQWSDGDAWGDFGGSYMEEDGCAENCAAREAWEETMCVMKFCSQDTLPLTSYTNLVEKLKKKDFLLKVSINQPDGATYITWVLEVPFDPLLPRRFVDWQKALRAHSYNASDVVEGVQRADLDIHPALARSRRANPTFLEKANVQMFSIPNLMTSLENNGALLWKFGRSEYLRASFMHRLALILDYLCPKFEIPRRLSYHSKPTIKLYELNH